MVVWQARHRDPSTLLFQALYDVASQAAATDKKELPSERVCCCVIIHATSLQFYCLFHLLFVSTRDIVVVVA